MRENMWGRSSVDAAAVTSVAATAAAAATVAVSFELRVFSGARVVTMMLLRLLPFPHVQ